MKPVALLAFVQIFFLTLHVYQAMGPIVGLFVAWMNGMIIMGGYMMVQQKKWQRAGRLLEEHGNNA